MPRYYFHFQDGGSRLTDREGQALPDQEAAWYHGVRSARDIIDQDLRVGAVRPGRLVEVMNDDGEQVWTVPFEEVIGLAV
jgi:hypothetical protein